MTARSMGNSAVGVNTVKNSSENNGDVVDQAVQAGQGLAAALEIEK